ncbi:MAG: hypothetical protein FWF83_01700 [Clostridiales bacterium]|nr:hypothetical protein [Clostridiales bacterium]
MIDFNSLNHILNNVPAAKRKSVGQYAPQGKPEPAQASAAQASATDVVQISSDAAMKGKLSAFASTLAKAMDDVGAERIDRLKEQYAGDKCPVSDADLAGAIIARIKAEGSWDE